jgi:hypothetical protein
VGWDVNSEFDETGKVDDESLVNANERPRAVVVARAVLVPFNDFGGAVAIGKCQADRIRHQISVLIHE